jgi:hypothetical protein
MKSGPASLCAGAALFSLGAVVLSWTPRSGLGSWTIHDEVFENELAFAALERAGTTAANNLAIWRWSRFDVNELVLGATIWTVEARGRCRHGWTIAGLGKLGHRAPQIKTKAPEAFAWAFLTAAIDIIALPKSLSTQRAGAPKGKCYAETSNLGWASDCRGDHRSGAFVANHIGCASAARCSQWGIYRETL